jgi:hypothetical protein
MNRNISVLWIFLAICFLAVLIANSALATTYHVPLEYASIQAAIEACQDFDTVVIAAGTYSGQGNIGMNFNGKAITVRSTDPTDPQVVNSTIIDCEMKGRGFAFNSGENADSKLMGLTITNGYGIAGGAILSYNNSSPSITNCVIRNNQAYYGGGIACGIDDHNSNPVIINCQIIANSAYYGGGGIYINGSSPTIKNCIISGNVANDYYSAGGEGGAIYSECSGNPLVVNCTISGNVASVSAGAIYCFNSSNLSINNCILWANTAPYASEIIVGNQGDPTSIQISYCNIQNPDENVIVETGCTIDWGQGNIDVDPCFVNPDSNDYHLLPESPCIDAGDPEFVAGPDETDIDGNPRIVNGIVDMGAFEAAFLDPVELLRQLTQNVIALNLQQGIENSLDSKLDAALHALDDINENNDVAAINTLEAFINAVEAQRGIKIPEADADALIADALQIIDLLSVG